MNIIVRSHAPQSRPSWKELAEIKLSKLQTLATIETARVAIDWQQRVKRAFRVMALLEVPGPDLHAEACDYTLQAALAKVVKSLERQIRSRKNRQNRRADKRRTNLQLRLSPNHGSPGPIPARVNHLRFV